jgi:hypothetical protein
VSGASPAPEANASPEEDAPEANAAPAPVADAPGASAEDAGGRATGGTGEVAGRTPGWREVLLVSAAVVLLVLGASVVTGYLPTDVQRLVFHEPLLIGFLVLGTILVLWSVARRRPPA